MLKKLKKIWIYLLEFLPLLSFLLFFYFSESLEKALMLGSSFILVIYPVFRYLEINIDPLILSANLFLPIGTCGFIFDNEILVSYYSTYTGASFMACILISGILLTLFRKIGFIGSTSHDSNFIRKSSLLLLLATFIGFMWSIFMNQYGIIVAAILPFIALKILREILINKKTLP